MIVKLCHLQHKHLGIDKPVESASHKKHCFPEIKKEGPQVSFLK